MEEDGKTLWAPVGDPRLTISVSFRTINGILAMPAFNDHFSTGFRKPSSTPGEPGDLSLSPNESSLIVAILSAGTVLGALLAAPFGDTFGRRLSLILGVFVFAFGGVFQVCAQDVATLLVGR